MSFSSYVHVPEKKNIKAVMDFPFSPKPSVNPSHTGKLSLSNSAWESLHCQVAHLWHQGISTLLLGQNTA
jgi:hypothetical protein